MIASYGELRASCLLGGIGVWFISSEPVLDAVLSRGVAGRDADLAVDRAEVRVHGARADYERFSHLRIAQPSGHKPQNTHFALGEVAGVSARDGSRCKLGLPGLHLVQL